MRAAAPSPVSLPHRGDRLRTGCSPRDDAKPRIAKLSAGSGFLSRVRKNLMLLLMPLALVLPASAQARGGRLDRGFGEGGRVTTMIGPYTAGIAAAAAWAPGGRIVLATGRTAVEYMANGRLDRNFGDGGRLQLELPSGTAGFVPSAMTVDSRGRLLVAWSTETSRVESTKPASVTVARYLPNGRLDPSFGNGGSTDTTFGFPPPAAAEPTALPGATEPLRIQGPVVEAFGLTVDSANRPIVTGAWADRQTLCYPENFTLHKTAFVARLDEDGSIDPTFGVGGAMSYPEQEAAERPLLNAEGLLFLGSHIQCVRGPHPHSQVEAITKSGEPNPRFGSGGHFLLREYESTPAIARESGGGIFVLYQENDQRKGPLAALLHFTRGGRPDPRFGNRGGIRFPIPQASESFGDSLQLAADRGGRAVIAVATRGRYAAFQIQRRDRLGGIDPSFGRHGQVITKFAGSASPTGVLIGGGGKIVVFGTLKRGHTYGVVLARYLAR